MFFSDRLKRIQSPIVFMLSGNGLALRSFLVFWAYFKETERCAIPSRATAHGEGFYLPRVFEKPCSLLIHCRVEIFDTLIQIFTPNIRVSRPSVAISRSFTRASSPLVAVSHPLACASDPLVCASHTLARACHPQVVTYGAYVFAALRRV
jgi:hypothetical protein